MDSSWIAQDHVIRDSGRLIFGDSNKNSWRNPSSFAYSMRTVKKISLQICLLLFSLTFLALRSRAETVILTTGEKIEGKIVRETEAEITVEYRVSASISDERVIPKSDIQKIEKMSPDDLAFQELRNLKINPQTSFSPDVYNRVINQLKNFLESYPASAHTAEVKQTLAAFQAEKARADAGEMKFQGKWLSKGDVAKDRIQIEGQQAFDMMKYQMSRQDWSGTLNTFDLIEKKYSATRVYPDAVDLAVQILLSLQKQVADRQKMIVYNQNDFQKAIQMAKPEDVSKLREGDKREQDQYAAAIAAAKKDGVKWMPFIPRSSESMNAFQTAILGELNHLKVVPVQKMHASIGLVNDARAAQDSKQTASAVSLVGEALKAWPQNEEAIRLKDDLSSVKATETKAAVAAANAREEALKKIAGTKDSAPKEEDGGKPWYMTLNGALMIAGGVLVLIGAVSILGRMKKAKGKDE